MWLYRYELRFKPVFVFSDILEFYPDILVSLAAGALACLRFISFDLFIHIFSFLQNIGFDLFFGVPDLRLTKTIFYL